MAETSAVISTENQPSPERPERDLIETSNPGAFELLSRVRAATDSHDSHDFHSRLTAGFKTRFGADSNPLYWQLVVSEALHLGLDCTVIAATGAGKTVPFVLSLLADDSRARTVLIICPLKELQEDQVRKSWSICNKTL
jgi:hypothetical protein